MTHSYKKHAFSGITTAKSEKKDKRIVNRKVRHKVNQALKFRDNFSEDELYLDTKDVSEVYDFAKDGKQRIDKNSEHYKKAIRK